MKKKVFKGLLVVLVLLVAVVMLNGSGVLAKSIKKKNETVTQQQNGKTPKWIIDKIKQIPEIKKKVRKYLIKNPSVDIIGDIIFWLDRAIINHPDTKEIVEKYKIIQFYTEIIRKSQNTEVIKGIIGTLIHMGNYCNKKQEIIPILKNELNNKFADVRLYAADELVKIDKKYKKDVYHVYVDILTMKEKDLKNMLENRPLPYGYKEYLKSAKELNNSKEIKDANLAIEFFKIDPIITSLGKLMMNYNDKKTKKILRKVIKNNYIFSIINRYDKLMEESLKISKKNKLKRIKRKKLSEKIVDYINDKEK